MNLAVAPQAAGDEARAVGSYQAMLAPALEKLGPDHAVTATCVQNLRTILETRQDQAALVRLGHAVWVARKKMDGLRDPKVIAPTLWFVAHAEELR